MPYFGRATPIETGALPSVDLLSGDGATTSFALSWTPPSEQALFVFIDGVLQHTDAYSLSGSNLIFSVAPDVGTDNIEVRLVSQVGKTTVPADNSVTPSKTTGMLNAIQQVYVQDGEVATGTTIIPNDDTIPQNTEGEEYMSLSITPTSASSILLIEVHGQFASTATNQIAMALFQDSIADALATVSTDRGGSGTACGVDLRHRMVAGTTSPITFKIRAGGHTTGTTTFNGYAGVRDFGGTFASHMMITEYKA